MSFSSGTYSLVAGNPVVTGTTISSTWANNTLNDIATALSTCVLKDGTQTTTAAVPFAFGITIPTGKNVTGAGTATLTGFKSLSVGSSGNLGAIAINGSTSGAINLTTDATATKAILDKPFDIGANALTSGAFTGTTLDLVTGATNHMKLQNTSDSTTYNIISFNGNVTDAGKLGLSGGGGTDKNLYIDVPTGGTHQLRINNAAALLTNTTGIQCNAVGINAAPTSTSKLHIAGIPTSSAGLASGDVWANSNVLTIVP